MEIEARGVLRSLRQGWRHYIVQIADLFMNLGAFFAASNLETPQKTGLSASIPQRHRRTLAGFP
jgi:hypothetical protein